MSWVLTEQSEGLTVEHTFSEDSNLIFVDYSEAADNLDYLQDIYQEVSLSEFLPDSVKERVLDELRKIESRIGTGVLTGEGPS